MIIVYGDHKVEEMDNSIYYPFWLRDEKEQRVIEAYQNNKTIITDDDYILTITRVLIREGIFALEDVSVIVYEGDMETTVNIDADGRIYDWPVLFDTLDILFERLFC